jgi:hypothetical protein
MKPSFRQTAFDPAFATDGNTWMYLCVRSARALAMAGRDRGGRAMPRRWNGVGTLQPIS